MRDILRALFRYRRRAIAVFLATIATVVVALIFWPRTYTSEAKLFVRVGRESVTLDPTATTGGPVISLNDSRNAEINSVVQVLSSRALIEKVVDKLGPDVILASANEPLVPAPVVSSSTDPAETAKKREDAILTLSKDIRVGSPRDSSIIDISCSSSSPRRAQHILNTLVEIFRVEHLRVNRTPGSFDFFSEQSGALKAELDEATQALQDAKTSYGLVSIDGRRAALQDQTSKIEVQIRETQAARSAAEAKVAALHKTIQSLPDLQIPGRTTGLPDDATDEMRDQLYTLQIKEQELLATHTEQHPLVIAIREQVRAAEKIYQSHASTAVSANHQPLQLALLTEKANAASLLAQADALDRQYSELQDDFKTLNHQEIHIHELQRRVDLLETNYRNYAERLESARVDRELQSQLISNVNVVQDATLVLKHTSPKKGLALLFGLLLATLGGIGVALASDQLDRSLKSPEAVEKVLQIPVLASIPVTHPSRIFLGTSC